MKQPIMLKLVISYIIFGFVTFGILTISTTFFSNVYYRQNLVYNVHEDAVRIANYYEDENYSDVSQYANLADSINLIIDDKETAWILNKDGELVYSSEKISKKLSKTLPDTFNPDDFNKNHFVTNAYNDYLNKSTISIIANIGDENDPAGYVVLHVPSKIINDILTDTISFELLMGTILMIFSVLPLLIVIVFVIKPLRKINKAAKEFAKGNFKVNSINVTSHDELAELATSLNTMASQLADREEYQRKFISNVSHDFRSPLTSIKGYLEAILDGTIPSELYEKYLNVVLSETNRLTKLAAGLIDLSAVDSNDIVLFQTVYDINQTIFDTVNVFEMQCQKKGIIVDIECEDTSYEVYADKDKMSQVFSNLLDNAIKFSDDNSTIYVHVYDKGSKVFVSIKDTGVGIAADAIDKIWGRFYKSDTSRGRVKNSSGIGLSIVKEIVQAHGEDINVTSTPGEGTKFVYSIPKKGSSVK